MADVTGGANNTGGNGTGGTGVASGTGGLCNSGPFVSLDLVTGLNVTGDLWSPTLSADDLTLYFSVWDGIADRTLGKLDIWTATRSNVLADFGSLTPLTAINSSFDKVDLALSHDETELFFVSDWTTSSQTIPTQIWRATRACQSAGNNTY